jgi:hypothetical protein
MKPINELFAGLELGAAAGFANLAVFPLHWSEAPAGEPGYRVLHRALEEGTLTITEVSEGGSVPNLLLKNSGALGVLVLDGEELVGAKQNRVANATFLAPAGKTITIPVSCVEAGRWSYSSPGFASEERVMFSRARAAKSQRVSESLKQAAGYDANQGAVWDEIDAAFLRKQSASPTRSMRDLYVGADAKVAAYLDALPARDGQAGLVFCIDGRAVGLELFDHPATCAEQHRKLVRSYAMDAIDTMEGREAGGGQEADPQTARDFLDTVTAAAIEPAPAIGEGQPFRVASARVCGGGLAHEGQLVHLCAFAVEGGPGDGPAPDLRMQRASRRSRHYRG